MINPINNSINPINFCKKNNKNHITPDKNNEKYDENPISRKGETMKLITATFIGGLALAGKLLFGLVEDGDFLVDILGDLTKKTQEKKFNNEQINKLIDKAKNKGKEFKNKKILSCVGIFVSLLAVFFCGFALLYTAFNAPKISYNSKINSFKKGKEMDVYIKANAAERELYTQLDEKAKLSNAEEKKALKEQYLKMKNAKNQVPEFVNINNKSQ